MASMLFRDRYRVPTTRLPGWDYRWPGAYAVTICVRNRVCCLGDIVEAEMALSPLGVIVAEEWLAIPRLSPQVVLDEWIIMPDHLHGILILQGADRPSCQDSPAAESLSIVVGQKRATQRIRAQRRPDFSWQERYFDQILWNQEELARYRIYIQENPRRWQPPS